MHDVLLSSISFQVILNLYGSESGREINTEKLEILFSVNTPIAIKRTIGPPALSKPIQSSCTVKTPSGQTHVTCEKGTSIYFTRRNPSQLFSLANY